VARSTHDAAELLGVEMEQVARALVLVAVGRLDRPGSGDETVAAQRPVTGRGGQPEECTEPVGTPAERTTQGHDAGLVDDGEPLWAGVWSGAAVEEAGMALGVPAWQPSIVDATADPEGETSRRGGHARPHGFEDPGATAWRQSGVGMTMHRGALPSGWLFSNPNLPGDGLRFVTNVVKEQT